MWRCIFGEGQLEEVGRCGGWEVRVRICTKLEDLFPDASVHLCMRVLAGFVSSRTMQDAGTRGSENFLPDVSVHLGEPGTDGAEWGGFYMAGGARGVIGWDCKYS
ncbi:hypothetical protein CRG98_011925 [Punica granatum]|uniref:Uncharacterized protein n=1 Tax=Punica granatum TaxID=22663 RepID=A0A2I0KGR3_PUNGR|nr:hypothetical protein CRG98_011925 [Punica granatum]